MVQSCTMKISGGESTFSCSRPSGWVAVAGIANGDLVLSPRAAGAGNGGTGTAQTGEDPRNA